MSRVIFDREMQTNNIAQNRLVELRCARIAVYVVASIGCTPNARYEFDAIDGSMYAIARDRDILWQNSVIYHRVVETREFGWRTPCCPVSYAAPIQTIN